MTFRFGRALRASTAKSSEIDADGDDTNIDKAVIDQLRDYGLTPIDVDELNILDNQ